MGVSNLRKLKKKNKKMSTEGIENLIELIKELEPSYDISNLNRTLSLCKSIKPGAWGEHVELNIGGTRVSWSVSDDFKQFTYIYKRAIDKIKYINSDKPSIYHYTKSTQERMGEVSEKLTFDIDKAVDRIDDKYRAEMRDSLINSLLDE